MLNWTDWNKTVFDIETVYLCSTELFEKELFFKLNLCTYTLLNHLK